MNFKERNIFIVVNDIDKFIYIGSTNNYTNYISVVNIVKSTLKQKNINTLNNCNIYIFDKKNPEENSIFKICQKTWNEGKNRESILFSLGLDLIELNKEEYQILNNSRIKYYIELGMLRKVNWYLA